MLLKAKEIILLLSGEEGARFFRVINTVKKKKQKTTVVKFEVNKLVNSVIPHGNIEMRPHKTVSLKVINRSYKWALTEIQLSPRIS